MSNVYLTSIEIRDLGGIPYLKTELGAVNLIVGDNHTGKTTILSCISMFFETGGPSVDLLRRGCASGQATITLSNGYSAQGKLAINEKKGGVDWELKVFEPDGGEKKAGVTFLKSMLDRGTFNPLNFLQMDDKDKTAFLLKYASIAFSPEDINVCFNTPVGKVKLEPVTQYSGPAVSLAKFNELREEKFSARTEINRQISDLEGTIRDLQASSGLSGEDAVKDWPAERDRIQGELSEVTSEIATATANVQLDAEKERTAQRTDITRAVKANRVIIDAYLGNAERFLSLAVTFAVSPDPKSAHDNTRSQGELLYEQLSDFMEAVALRRELELKLGSVLKTIDQVETDTIREQTAALEEKRAALSEDLGTAKSRATVQTEAAGVRKAILEREAKLKGATLRSEQFTGILRAMDRLRVKTLTKTVNVDGFDIRFDGNRPVLMIDDLPLSQRSGQEQLFTAIQFIRAAQKANNSDDVIPMILSESSEVTDTYLPMLTTATKTAKMQLTVTRLEAGAELHVEVEA